MLFCTVKQDLQHLILETCNSVEIKWSVFQWLWNSVLYVFPLLDHSFINSRTAHTVHFSGMAHDVLKISVNHRPIVLLYLPSCRKTSQSLAIWGLCPTKCTLFTVSYKYPFLHTQGQKLNSPQWFSHISFSVGSKNLMICQHINWGW